jgi:hypothetical protein
MFANRNVPEAATDLTENRDEKWGKPHDVETTRT